MRIVRPAEEARSLSLQVHVAPAYDLVISLAAAAHPDRYEVSRSWARALRRALPPSVRHDFTLFFGDSLSLGLGVLQLIPELPDAEPETLLRRLREMEVADFTAALLSRGGESPALPGVLRRLALGKALSAEDDAVLKAHLAGLRAESRKRFKEILEIGPEVKARYVALLEAQARGPFAAEYRGIAPFLAQRAKQARRNIGKLPAKELIARLTGGFTLQDPATQSVALVPAYWASPFVFVVRDGRDVVLVYGARPVASAAERAALDVDTVRVLKALSDETRLRILQLLAQRPLYGQQLAETLGLSHPTVSHHMAQLRIAGLTRTELADDGNKTYSVRPETIEALCSELRAAFVEPARVEEETG